jgi:hypothetical protein
MSEDLKLRREEEERRGKDSRCYISRRRAVAKGS